MFVQPECQYFFAVIQGSCSVRIGNLTEIVHTPDMDDDV
jgi:hypothetical protein